MRTAIPFALLAATLAGSLFAAPAHAARDRVFVASFGTDSGNTTCSFTQPCRTFQNAINNVAAGGEVTAIDSAGFGPISISHAVTITSPPGIEAGIVTSLSPAISITAASTDTVTLRGLTLDGAGTIGLGIDFTSGGRLEVFDCVVRDFTQAGIVVGSQAPTSLAISNTVVTGMTAFGAPGIVVFPSAGAGITGVLDAVTLDNDSIGLNLIGAAPIELLVSNSHIDNSTNTAIDVAGSGSGLATLFLKNVTLNQNPNNISQGGNSAVYLSQVTQTAAAGFTSNSGIDFNGSNNSAFGDGTNHFSSGLAGGASVGTWSPSF